MAKQKMKDALDEAAKKEKEENARKEAENLAVYQDLNTDDHRLQAVSSLIDELEKDKNGNSLSDIKFIKNKQQMQ